MAEELEDFDEEGIAEGEAEGAESRQCLLEKGREDAEGVAQGTSAADGKVREMKELGTHTCG